MIFTPASFPAFHMSGKAWATPWSVTAIAGIPQYAARFTTAFGSVSASIAEKRVCRCSSTRFSFALSGRTVFFVFTMLRGSMTMSSSNLDQFTWPWIRRQSCSLIRSRILWSSSARR